jgi:hypothetical protein
MKKTCLLAVAAGMACCSVALAKPPLEMARPGAQLEPISVAKVSKVNGKIVLASDWMPYTGGMGTRSGGPINAPLFDSFGREPGTAPTGGAGTNCTVGCTTAWLDGHTDNGTRWYFGSAYQNPNTIEDMQDCACPASSTISEVDFGWFWGPAVPERCIVIYFPLEEVLAFDPVSGTCNDESSFTATGGGVAFDFGTLACGCPFYYYSRPTGIESLGVLSPATDDNGDPNGFADGSYQMIIANDITSSAIILAAGPSQPMLWGTTNGWNGTQSTGFNPAAPAYAGDCRPGNNNGDSYDDDAPTDGVLSNPGECYDYTYGICPDPIGKDNCFCYLRCTSDYNNDGFPDGIDYDSFNNDFEAGSPCADLNGDCFVDGIDSDYFNNEHEATVCP